MSNSTRQSGRMPINWLFRLFLRALRLCDFLGDGLRAARCRRGGMEELHRQRVSFRRTALRVEHEVDQVWLCAVGILTQRDAGHEFAWREPSGVPRGLIDLFAPFAARLRRGKSQACYLERFRKIA